MIGDPSGKDDMRKFFLEFLFRKRIRRMDVESDKQVIVCLGEAERGIRCEKQFAREVLIR